MYVQVRLMKVDFYAANFLMPTSQIPTPCCDSLCFFVCLFYLNLSCMLFLFGLQVVYVIICKVHLCFLCVSAGSFS